MIVRSMVRIALVLVLLVAIQAPLAAKGPPASASPAEVTFPNGDLRLHGFLWMPQGSGSFPAVLWNHGSEKLPGSVPDVANFFLRNGFVFFVPHRRGQGRSPGPYIQDQLAQARTREEQSRLLVRLHEIQLTDQLAALSYLKGVAGVDAGRIAVAGCSYGGIQTVLAAERNVGYRAAVNFAGAAQSWSQSVDLQARMIAAVRAATASILFVQAQNDYDLTPTRVLAAEMQRAGKPYSVRLYPPFGNSTQAGHLFCVTGAEVWGPDVLAFLNDNLK